MYHTVSRLNDTELHSFKRLSLCHADCTFKLFFFNEKDNLNIFESNLLPTAYKCFTASQHTQMRPCLQLLTQTSRFPT